MRTTVDQFQLTKETAYAIGCFVGMQKFARSAEREHGFGNDLPTAAGALGGTVGGMFVLPKLMLRSLSKLPAASPEDIRALQVALHGKHVPVRKLSPMVKAIAPGFEKQIGPGAYIPGSSGKGTLGAIKQMVMQGVWGDESPMRKRQTRRGIITHAGAGISLPTVAHELGHATGRHKLHGLRTAGMMTGIISPSAAYVLGHRLSRDPDESIGRALTRSGLAGAGTGLAITGSTLLPEEIRASMRGLRGLKLIGKAPAVRRAAAWQLGKALSTYGMAATVPAAVAAMLGTVLARRKARSLRDELEADTSPAVAENDLATTP